MSVYYFIRNKIYGWIIHMIGICSSTGINIP